MSTTSPGAPPSACITLRTGDVKIRTNRDRMQCTATRHTCPRRHDVMCESLIFTWRRVTTCNTLICIIYFSRTNDAEDERKSQEYWIGEIEATVGGLFSMHRKIEGGWSVVISDIRCIERAYWRNARITAASLSVSLKIIMRRELLESKLIRLYDMLWHRWPSATLYNK